MFFLLSCRNFPASRNLASLGTRQMAAPAAPAPPAPAAAATGTLKLLSWNVAGLDPILKLLKGAASSLEQWMLRQGLDVLCVQEAKLSQESVRLAGPQVD